MHFLDPVPSKPGGIYKIDPIAAGPAARLIGGFRIESARLVVIIEVIEEAERPVVNVGRGPGFGSRGELGHQTHAPSANTGSGCSYSRKSPISVNRQIRHGDGGSRCILSERFR